MQEREPQPISDVFLWQQVLKAVQSFTQAVGAQAARRGFAWFGAREDPVLPSALCRSKEQTGAGAFTC